jgi:hypothetical protein
MFGPGLALSKGPSGVPDGVVSRFEDQVMTTTTGKMGLLGKIAAAALGAALALTGCGAGGGSSGGGASGGSVVATVPTHHSVVRVDTQRRVVTARAAVPVPGFVAQDPVRARVYVGSASHDLVALDSDTLSERGRVVAPGIRDIAVARDGSRIFTLSVTGNTALLEARDPVTLEVVASTGTPAGLASRAFYSLGSLMAIEPSGLRIALVSSGACWLVSTTSFAAQSIALPASFDPTDIAFSTDGRTLFAGGSDRDQKQGRLIAIDVRNGGIAFDVDGGTADYTAVAPSSSQAFVTGSFFGLSGVGAIDLDAQALMTAIPDDRVNYPADLAVTAGGALLVAASNAQDGSGRGKLVLFDGRSLRAVGAIALEGPSGTVIAVR